MRLEKARSRAGASKAVNWLKSLWEKVRNTFNKREVHFYEDKVKLYGKEEKDWLIIFYGAGDNNLKNYIYQNLNDIEEKAPTEIAHTLALIDVGKSFWGFKGAKIFYLQRDDSFTEVKSPVLADLGQVNVADPKLLAGFIVEAMRRFPAKHLAIIMAGHGRSWYGALPDESHGKAMSLRDMKRAFQQIYEKTGKKVDLLAWDACLMASAEVGYALRHYVKYMVASEAEEGPYGWYYLQVMDSLRAVKPGDLTPEKFAKTVVEAIHKASRYGYDQVDTISAVNLERADELAKRIDKFSKALLETDKPNKSLLYAIFSAESFGGESVDLADLTKRIAESEDIKDEKLKRAAKDLYDFITQEYVIANYSDEKYPDAKGVSISLPLSESYKSTDIAKDTNWDEAMKGVTLRNEGK